jgi:hypothetical protein
VDAFVGVEEALLGFEGEAVDGTVFVGGPSRTASEEEDQGHGVVDASAKTYRIVSQCY